MGNQHCLGDIRTNMDSRTTVSVATGTNLEEESTVDLVFFSTEETTQVRHCYSLETIMRTFSPKSIQLVCVIRVARPLRSQSRGLVGSDHKSHPPLRPFQSQINSRRTPPVSLRDHCRP